MFLICSLNLNWIIVIPFKIEFKNVVIIYFAKYIEALFISPLLIIVAFILLLLLKVYNVTKRSLQRVTTSPFNSWLENIPLINHCYNAFMLECCLMSLINIYYIRGYYVKSMELKACNIFRRCITSFLLEYLLLFKWVLIKVSCD